jgi:ribosome biogenesis GTPase
MQHTGRVISDHKGGTNVLVNGREYLCVVSGKLRRAFKAGEALKPVVGDFVTIEPQPGDERAVIHAVEPRKTEIRRKMAGEDQRTQVVLANVDVVFVTMALNEDFNVRRLERYLTMVWDGRARPVVLLSKADLCDDLEARLGEVRAVAPREEIIVTSHTSALGLAALDASLKPGLTYALLGSSGVGKSTLVNRWMGNDAQSVKEIRDDGKGRHTTTHRELFSLPSGALVIDTPGMRELGLDHIVTGVDDAFSDIDAFRDHCRFADCSHVTEPGCGVLAAVEAGTLPRERYDSYLKLKREVAARAAGGDVQQRAARKRSKERVAGKPKRR